MARERLTDLDMAKGLAIFLVVLGQYALAIYLMNTILIGVTKGALSRILPWDHQNFLLFFPSLLAAGLIGPVVLHRSVLARVRYLGGITRVRRPSAAPTGRTRIELGFARLVGGCEARSATSA